MRPNRLKIVSFIAAGTMLVGSLAVPRAEADNPIGRELKPPAAEPEYVDLVKDHAAMHRAVLKARKTVGTFIAALQHPAPGQADFEVKKPFMQGNAVEHIWLSDVQFIGNRFQGRVDNTPRKIRGLKLGALVSVNPDEISDWAFVDNGKLVGGYTIRAFYRELSPKQKREFDQAADFRIGRK